MGRFALLKRYEVMREEFVFPEKVPLAYAYPRKKPSPLIYRGLGREERDLYDPLTAPLPKDAAALIAQLEEGTLAFPDLLRDREMTLLYASAFDDAEDYECVFVAAPEESAPADLILLGYDVGYAPGEELFSAVSDLFFFPVWQPDTGGKAFLPEFRSLNENGLFRTPEEAGALCSRYEEAFGDGGLLVLAVYSLPEKP